MLWSHCILPHMCRHTTVTQASCRTHGTFSILRPCWQHLQQALPVPCWLPGSESCCPCAWTCGEHVAFVVKDPSIISTTQFRSIECGDGSSTFGGRAGIGMWIWGRKWKWVRRRARRWLRRWLGDRGWRVRYCGQYSRFISRDRSAGQKGHYHVDSRAVSVILSFLSGANCPVASWG